MTQLDMDFSRALRDDGIRRSIEHAEADVPGWAAMAFDFLKRYCETHERFQAWMAVQESRPFLKIDNEKAWGGVIKKALSAGIIVKDGWAKNPKRHATDAPVYRSLIFKK